MDHQCQCGSTKRQSPSSLCPLQEPSSKRATFWPPSSSTAATTATFSGDHPRILGFTKLPLPPAFTNASSQSSSPALRRTSSPINSPGANNLSDQAPNSVDISPAAPLYRSISDPTPSSASYQVVPTTTPPRPPAARKVKRSPGAGEGGLILKEDSPNTKRLKRMKARMREMSQWWNEVIKE